MSNMMLNIYSNGHVIVDKGLGGKLTVVVKSNGFNWIIRKLGS